MSSLNGSLFSGVGISHTALAGIALGLVTGLDPFWCGSAFAVATALATGHISRRGRLYEDTVIGIFFAAGMALGIALLSSLRGYYPEIFSLLFGNILSVSAADLRLLAAVAAIVLLFIAIFFKELLAISFDEETAVASGLPVKFLYFGLLAAMALTVMVSVKLVGIVLASALLVIPAATGVPLQQKLPDHVLPVAGHRNRRQRRRPNPLLFPGSSFRSGHRSLHGPDLCHLPALPSA